MGLDFVEITMQIEETFGISFSEDDLQELVRDGDIVAGDLYDLILDKTRLRNFARNDIRLNHALWLELQAVIHSVTEVPLDQLELKTPLASLFPRKTRRQAWTALRDACPYRVQELDYPRIVRRVAFSLAALVVLIEQLQIWQMPGLGWLWPILGIFAIWMLIETYVKVLAVLRPLRNRFPSGITTLKDLCRAVLAANYTDLCQDLEIPVVERSAVVWQQLTEVLTDVLGVDAEHVTFRCRLVHDLGMS